LSGHSIARRLNIEEKKAVISLSESGVGPSQILSILKKDFNNKLSRRKEIHNFLAVTRLKMLGDKTPIQKLLEILQENDFHYAYKTSVSGANTNLFFSHYKSIELCQNFGNVFVMDCTYKTNLFAMPLLNVVGVTSTYHSFNAGFVFMCEEIKENYIWSLNQFKRCLGFSPKVISTDRELALMSAIVTVFPESKNILFVWHIEKNIYLIAKNTSPPKKHGQSLFDHGQVV